MTFSHLQNSNKKSNRGTVPVRNESGLICYNFDMERIPEQLPEPWSGIVEVPIESEILDEVDEFSSVEFANKIVVLDKCSLANFAIIIDLILINRFAKFWYTVDQ